MEAATEYTLGLLLSMVRHFVPLVAENGKMFLNAMLECSPLHEYMTPSDLAFAIVVVEHHVMRWQLLFQCSRKKKEGQQGVTEPTSSTGLVYEGGIAGRDAKQRFDALQMFIYENFYTAASPQSVLNMTRLQLLLDDATKADPASIQRDMKKSDSHAHLTCAIQNIRNDVLHRVFYYMYI